MKFNQTTLICQIEDIIKGKNRFFIKETIHVAFLDRWMNCEKSFEEGKSYFLPVTVRGCTLNDCQYFTLQIFGDNNCSIYPIDNGIIQTKNNFFNISESSNWDKFKVAFINQYISNLEE